MEKDTRRGLYQAKAARRLGRRSAWTVPWFTPPRPNDAASSTQSIDAAVSAASTTGETLTRHGANAYSAKPNRAGTGANGASISA
jgi:hypothetical protein